MVGAGAAAAVMAAAVTASTVHSQAHAKFYQQAPVGLNAVLGPTETPTTESFLARSVTRNGSRLSQKTLSSEMAVMGALAPERAAASVKVTTTDPPTTATYDPATNGMGAPGSFQACVAWRESSDGQASSDIYGILPYIWNDVIGFAGSPYDASLTTQDAAFWTLYNMDGTSPWAPYDGC